MNILKTYLSITSFLSLFLLSHLSNSQPKNIIRSFPDSISVVAEADYLDASLLRFWMMGKNYREEWATPVMLPVFDMKALEMTPVELGGGRQTKSLQLKDKTGTEWALRTVDKDVRPAIPKLLRNPLFVFIVQDLVSAANPYAPLTIPTLAGAAGIPCTKPVFYYVPADTVFGKFSKHFADKICLLEVKNVLPSAETKNSVKLMKEIFNDYKTRVDQKSYLRARMLDMLIADWDRHYDQWKWAKRDSAGFNSYVALPKDRDQAYFYSRGWLLKFIRLFGMQFSVGFTETTKNIVKLNSVAYTFDQLMLNSLSSSDWKTIATAFTDKVTDDTIEAAIKKLPAEQYKLHGKIITEKLKKRKSTIADDVIKYYKALAKEPIIYGSDKAEKYLVTGNKDSIMLEIKGRENNTQLFKRTFYPSETKRILIQALGGDDEVLAEIDGATSIKLKIDGGEGKNIYSLPKSSNFKAYDSDLNAEKYLKKLKKPLKIVEEI